MAVQERDYMKGPESAPVKPGGGSFHHGLAWHGSAPNTNAAVARMALVTHMLPVEVKPTAGGAEITFAGAF